MFERYRLLLVATDGSETGDRAVSFAVAFARRHESELLVCEVVDRIRAIAECSSVQGFDTLPLVEALDAAAKASLAAAAARVVSAGVPVTTILVEGRPSGAVIACANAHRVDAIVMGTQGKHGATRFFLGSTAEDVLRRADVPVFVVPPGATDASATAAFERIVVAVDGSDSSDSAVTFALRLARSDASRLTLCNAAQTREDRRSAARILASNIELARRADVAAESVITEGTPADEILKTAEAKNAQLIVLGTHGRRGVERLIIGSVAESVVRRSRVPVVVVRASGARANESASRLSSRVRS